MKDEVWRTVREEFPPKGVQFLVIADLNGERQVFAGRLEPIAGNNGWLFAYTGITSSLIICRFALSEIVKWRPMVELPE